MTRKDQRYEVTQPDGSVIISELVKGNITPLSPEEADRIHVHVGTQRLRRYLDSEYPRMSRWVPDRLISAFVKFRDRSVLPSTIDRKIRPFLDQFPEDPNEKNMVRLTRIPPPNS